MMDVEIMNGERMWFHKIAKFELMKKLARRGVNIYIHMYILHDVLASSIISYFAHLPPRDLFKLVALFK